MNVSVYMDVCYVGYHWKDYDKTNSLRSMRKKFRHWKCIILAKSFTLTSIHVMDMAERKQMWVERRVITVVPSRTKLIIN